MAATKLSDDEVQQHMTHLPGWSRQGDSITRQYQFADFDHALEFVIAVGRAAEDVKHHPDMDIRYNKVTLTLTTHDAGGLTEADMEMAASADGAADALGAS
ncbi:MAG: 4a-hydroxytetrahydrobiopterin dehydratase [Armatimonadetes bacterium]|nr:4a-hydroxytetrahydrobiopterin dehydratase [Armatimonadota bacterium]